MTSVSKKFVSAVATTAVVVTVFALLALAALIVAGYKPEVVKSGSMRPMLSRGSLIFVKSTAAASLRTGDVITFENPLLGGKNTVTHRIVAIRPTARGPAFATKGDANGARDPWQVHIPSHAGLYKFEVPYVGQLSFVVHSRNGYIALFALPLLLVALMTLRRIWREPQYESAGEERRVVWLGDPAH